jgi:hypothetical protein
MWQKSALSSFPDVKYVIWRSVHIFVKNELANQMQLLQLLRRRSYVVTWLRWIAQISYADSLPVW